MTLDHPQGLKDSDPPAHVCDATHWVAFGTESATPGSVIIGPCNPVIFRRQKRFWRPLFAISWPKIKQIAFASSFVKIHWGGAYSKFLEGRFYTEWEWGGRSGTSG